MTLANLKKCTPSADRKLVSVDEFIDGADYYQKGLSKVIPLSGASEQANDHEKTLRRATFTLGDMAISTLDQLCSRTGIAKSRLIRIWLDEQNKRGDVVAYLASTVK